MEDSWVLSTPMPPNANTPPLEKKETKTQKELYIAAPTESANWKPA